MLIPSTAQSEPTLHPLAHTVDRAEHITGQGLGEAENTTHARSFSQETKQNLSLNLELRECC